MLMLEAPHQVDTDLDGVLQEQLLIPHKHCTTKANNLPKLLQRKA